ncbi:hypothetical protein [Pseudomonas helvetica]|uniref:hypothetical protein n=1 Tax=Pseudomonas helvetica TaxID=3136738 RepID=UPI003265CBD4
MTTDTQVLIIPVIVQPVEGATEQNKVKVSGIASKTEKGDVVEIAKAGSGHFLLRREVSEDGHWSGTLDEDLPKGVHMITARLIRGTGTGPWSPARTFTVD